ncbi:MAG: hypothetical protein HYR63_08080 [Proteobacteria bacterium]|nr:hypothetical protein [Pseudomonadota bacterium]MBI3499777.1 hypothetical protein [Pseudomonadota bacterium]
MVQFIQPPTKLIDKTGKGNPGLAAIVLKKANEAVKRHLDTHDYRMIAEASLIKMNTSWRQLLAEPHNAETVRRIYEVAHNLRGEGASFGYPAVSSVAGLICRVTEHHEEHHPKRLKVVGVHVDSLKAMVRYNVKGDPNGIALEVISALAILVDLYLGPWALRH